ncbi:glutamate receptor ionotropic, delta-1 [Procambarus clarkii]|uniref:glutamate receptor ionotropic, delta-1 n=1 Tax=Procambarus clarkii TaxID=6728 RepID=UPI003744451C
MGYKMRIVTTSVVLPYLDYQRASEIPGTAVTLTDSCDARLIHTFAAKLNFTFDVHEVINRTWGVETNGTFTGTIGLLQREEMDFSTLTVPTANRLRVVEFLNAYPADTLSITSLKPTLLPKSLALIRPFEGEVWVALLVSVVMWGVTLWLMERAWQWVAGGRQVALNTTFLYAWGALLQNLPSEPSVNFSSRMLVGWWLVFCLIVTTGFSSSLMAHLTVQGRSRPLKTFQDLVNQPGWRWGTPPWILSEAVVDYFVKHPNPAVNQVYQKMEVIREDEPLKKVLAGGFSLIFLKDFATINIATRYTDARGNTPFYISRDIPVFLGAGWCIRKGAPFRKEFSQLMTRLDAAGFTTYWPADVIASKVREKRKALKLDTTTVLGDIFQDEGEEVVLSLNHLQGAFYMLLVGSCVAFLTLLGENLAHCCSSPQ